jgi:hypothetical protein
MVVVGVALAGLSGANLKFEAVVMLSGVPQVVVNTHLSSTPTID